VSSRPRSVSSLNSVSRCVRTSAVAWSLATSAALAPSSLASSTAWAGAPVIDLGVGLAVADLMQVAVDEAGIGLRLATRRHLLAGVGEQVSPALVLQLGGRGRNTFCDDSSSCTSSLAVIERVPPDEPGTEPTRYVATLTP
jgi:hypothetical protein